MILFIYSGCRFIIQDRFMSLNIVTGIASSSKISLHFVLIFLSSFLIHTVFLMKKQEVLLLSNDQSLMNFLRQLRRSLPRRPALPQERRITPDIIGDAVLGTTSVRRRLYSPITSDCFIYFLIIGTRRSMSYFPHAGILLLSPDALPDNLSLKRWILPDYHH